MERMRSSVSVEIRIKDAVKKYGSNTVIQDLSLDIRGGVPLTVYYDMMGPYLTTRYIKVWDDFEPAEGGEDILEHCIKTDGIGAWCELER